MGDLTGMGEKKNKADALGDQSVLGTLIQKNTDSQPLAIRLSKKLFAGIFGGVFVIVFLFGLIGRLSGWPPPVFLGFSE